MNERISQEKEKWSKIRAGVTTDQNADRKKGSYLEGLALVQDGVEGRYDVQHMDVAPSRGTVTVQATLLRQHTHEYTDTTSVRVLMLSTSDSPWHRWIKKIKKESAIAQTAFLEG